MDENPRVSMRGQDDQLLKFRGRQIQHHTDLSRLADDAPFINPFAFRFDNGTARMPRDHQILIGRDHLGRVRAVGLRDSGTAGFVRCFVDISGRAKPIFHRPGSEFRACVRRSPGKDQGIEAAQGSEQRAQFDSRSKDVRTERLVAQLTNLGFDAKFTPLAQAA